MRMQKRHDNIVAQMKKELRSEGEKLVKWVDVSLVIQINTPTSFLYSH